MTIVVAALGILNILFYVAAFIAVVLFIIAAIFFIKVAILYLKKNNIKGKN